MAYQDLLKDTSAPDPKDKNNFIVTIEDLNPSQTYPIQFKWKFKDGSFGKDWSTVYNLVAGNEPSILPPHFPSTNVTGASGYIAVSWDGLDSDLNQMQNFDRIDIFIKDHSSNTTTTFGDGTKASAFFKSAGTKTISAPAGKYIVKLKTISMSGNASSAVPSTTNDYLVTVTSGLTIEDPTLPTGLSVSSVPFGVAVNWTGAYSSSSFFGFQSINIYASSTDYGSTTTSTNITNDKLVGTMSVNDSANKITVGLDALRTALSLSANKDCYTTNTYFYYIATNLNGVKYKSGGSEVYTRISSTPVKPTQANFVDLASGVISIENLVAGNGKFTTYLQTGTPDGARIELNGGNLITPSGQTNPILPGLSVYSSGSTAIFRADLSGNVSFGGYTPSDIASISTNANKGISDAALASSAAQTASTLAGTKNKIFVQDSVPSAVASGDVWVNTYDGTVSGYLGKYTNYVASSSGTSSWTAVSSVDAKNALGKIVGFNSDGSIFNKALEMPAGQGSIYSNKSAYANDTDNGWYLGYIPNTTKSAFSFGSSGTGLIKWDPDAGLRLTGAITSSATITTSGSYGSVALNGVTDSIDFSTSSGTVAAQLRTYNDNNEFILQYGNSRQYDLPGGYPVSTAAISLSPYGAQVGYINSSGTRISGFYAQNNGLTIMNGYWSASGFSLSTEGVRNVVAQTTAPTTTTIGTIWLQV